VRHHGRVPITLITGPANAGKARAVLDAVRAWCARGEQPWLIVPTAADVERYRRELAGERALPAEEGALPAGEGALPAGERALPDTGGVRVERFAGLIEELVRRAGTGGTALSALGRERALAVILRGFENGPGEVSNAPIGPGPARNRAARASPGFVRALARLVAELEAQRVTPARLRRALAAWTAADHDGAAEHAELGRLYERYRDAQGQARRVDPQRRAARALDALRRTPALWGGTPVALYGFDDLTPLQLDATETLGASVDAPVVVSLPYEPGRAAFAGRAFTFQTLAPLAAEHRELQARAEHYAPEARAALHHLERALFEPDAARADPDDAVRLLEGGDERAELELVAHEIAALLEEGTAPEEIALVYRSPGGVADLLEEVLQAERVPYALQRPRPFTHSAVGRALVGLLRCATPAGTAEDLATPAGTVGDLLAWLRAPGVLESSEPADRLEAQARRAGANDAARARALWERRNGPLHALDGLREAAERGTTALCERAAHELRLLFEAPGRASETPETPGHTSGRELEDDEPDEARALEAGERALEELRALARAQPELIVVGPGELALVLEGVTFVSGEPAGPGRVAVLDPLAPRARRVKALFLCGLQESVFPAPARPQPLFGEQERRRLAEASGLRLGRPEDALAAERYLLYATVSRPERLLVLSWHAADGEGVQRARSPFVDDVCDLFDACLSERRARRPQGAVGWPGAGASRSSDSRASTREEGLREEGSCAVPPANANGHGPGSPRGVDSRAADPPAPRCGLEPLREEELLEELRARTWSASSLELWASCPTRWFVERMLQAEDLDPRPEPLARGGLAHAALKDTFEGLRRETGSARLTPERLPRARALLKAALNERAHEYPLSVAPERVPGARRRLRADLERYLAHAAGACPGRTRNDGPTRNGPTRNGPRNGGAARGGGARPSPLEPSHFELTFGFQDEEEDGLPALDLGGVRLRGRVDRIDVGERGEAVVYDYKGRHAPPEAKWVQEGSLQVALYMRAAQELLGLRVVGGFYQPLAGADLRARGALDADSELECVRGDRLGRGELEELLGEMVAAARAAAAQAGRGELQARPRTCSFRGGCSYPTICRCGYDDR
jgi:RecB family exonuclease